MKTNNFAIFASGNGSNAEVLAKRALEMNYPLKVVISDQPNAFVIERMKKLHLDCVVVEKDKKQSKQDHEFSILEILKKYDVNWIFLAGYMKILSNQFLENFYESSLGVNKIINIHPSLLPSFKGKDGYGDAFHYGVRVSGVTVHFVDNGVDTGQIIAQEYFYREEGDQLEDFKARGLKIEHYLYPSVLDKIMNNNLIFFKRNS